MANELVQVPFHGDVIEAVQQNGDVWVPLRRICETLGLDVDGQRKKLKAKPWACTEMISVHDTTGRKQELFCIHKRSFPLWLATIDHNRVPDEIAPRLALLQTEAAEALADYFFGRAARPSVAPVAIPEHVQVCGLLQEVRELLRSADQRQAFPRQSRITDPRIFVLRCWPRCSSRTLQLIIRRMDTYYMNRLGRPAPQASPEDNAPLMCEVEHIWLLVRAMQYYWAKEHPEGQGSLPGMDEVDF